MDDPKNVAVSTLMRKRTCGRTGSESSRYSKPVPSLTAFGLSELSNSNYSFPNILKLSKPTNGVVYYMNLADLSCNKNQGQCFLVFRKLKKIRSQFFSRPSGAILSKFGQFWYQCHSFFIILARRRRKFLRFRVSKTIFPLI